MNNVILNLDATLMPLKGSNLDSEAQVEQYEIALRLIFYAIIDVRSMKIKSGQAIWMVVRENLLQQCALPNLGIEHDLYRKVRGESSIEKCMKKCSFHLCPIGRCRIFHTYIYRILATYFKIKINAQCLDLVV